MAYATRADIANIYSAEFLLDLTHQDVVDADGAVDQALEDASDEIDAYLSARYTVPIVPSPRVLRRPCVDIAAYVLANSHTRLTDTMEERYKQAIGLLKMIAKGDAGLGRDEPSAEIEGSTVSSPSGSDFSARPRRFGRGRSI